MLDPGDLAASHTALSTQEKQAIQDRIALFQTFRDLYDHHRDLLDSLLTLQDTNSHGHHHTETSFYIQGLIGPQNVSLVSNLVDEQSKAFKTPNHHWVLGRDPRYALLAIGDKRLSRAHAVIQYSLEQGFLITDLESTNGTYVNGERIQKFYTLRDGDKIRLGSLVCRFYVCALLTAKDISETVLDTQNIGFSSVSTKSDDQYIRDLKSLELASQTLKYPGVHL